jgi:hypothetical protein
MFLDKNEMILECTHLTYFFAFLCIIYRYVPRVFGFRVHRSARQRNTLPATSEASPPRQASSQQASVEQVEKGNKTLTGEEEEEGDQKEDGGSEEKPRTARTSKRRSSTDLINKANADSASNAGSLVMENTVKRRRRNGSS